jgi:hypothetical protein
MKKFIYLHFGFLLVPAFGVYGTTAAIEGQLQQAEEDLEATFQTIANAVGFPEDILSLREEIGQTADLIASGEGDLVENLTQFANLTNNLQLQVYNFIQNRPEDEDNPITDAMHFQYAEAIQRQQELLLLFMGIDVESLQEDEVIEVNGDGYFVYGGGLEELD